jgi:hypothetical protein
MLRTCQEHHHITSAPETVKGKWTSGMLINLLDFDLASGHELGGLCTTISMCLPNDLKKDRK